MRAEIDDAPNGDTARLDERMDFIGRTVRATEEGDVDTEGW